MLKGRKYSTEKQYIRNTHDQYSSFLRNAAITLSLSEEDFCDTKILAVTIVTNLSERLALDINLKSIGKKLSKEKYSINNQYFMVVNQNSQPVKMRVGLKMTSMRGTSLINNLADILSRNLDTEIFDEMSIPRELNNYEKMIDLWKNKLKISSRLFDDFLGELLKNKKKDKLNLNFFTLHTEFKLDFTPIMIDSEIEPESLCESL